MARTQLQCVVHRIQFRTARASNSNNSQTHSQFSVYEGALSRPVQLVVQEPRHVPEVRNVWVAVGQHGVGEREYLGEPRQFPSDE
jgi:hypothetical protein